MVSEEQKQMINREPPDTPEERDQYITAWHANIKDAKDRFFKPAYDAMLDNMRFVRGRQWSNQDNDERYRCNITLRFLQKRTAALYAKNPRAVAEMRSRLEFALWDEKPESLMMAQQMPDDPVMQMILMDFQQGMIRRTQFEGIARTLENLYAYYMGESLPPFKVQIKQLVRRVLTCGVGYVEISFQRHMAPTPNQQQRVKDFMNRLQHLESLAADLADEEIEEKSKEMEELQQAVQGVMAEEQMILNEGLILDFPKATAIIPDPNTSMLKHFIGSNWVTREWYMSPQEVKDYYKVDLGNQFTAYQNNPRGANIQHQASDKRKSLVRVWRVHDLLNGTELHLCDGYKDYLRQDLTPQLTFEQGHPYHVLTFNDIEDEKDIFPPSDVSLMRDQQMEYNRSRESLREHRIASRPAWISPKGMWDENDQMKLGNHLAHELLQLNIPATQNLDINKLLIAKPIATIDPNMYDVEFLFTDVLRATGDHEATFGGSSGDTATEVAVAEQSRVSSVESNIDDLDDFLTAIARDSGQVLLLNMSIDEVRKIVGPGAMWPEFSAQEAADEIMLQIQAGSSGRPNKSQELANFERIAPYLIQVPGINPRWLGEQMLQRMDDKLDLTEAFIEGMPSIMALNAMAKAAQMGGPPAASDEQGSTARSGDQPNQQGDQGGNNMENPQESTPGAQPAYPAAGPVM